MASFSGCLALGTFFLSTLQGKLWCLWSCFTELSKIFSCLGGRNWTHRFILGNNFWRYLKVLSWALIICITCLMILFGQRLYNFSRIDLNSCNHILLTLILNLSWFHWDLKWLVLVLKCFSEQICLRLFWWAKLHLTF